jgi:hypothetical protein
VAKDKPALTTDAIEDLDAADAAPFEIAFTPQERRVAEAYILTVKRQTKLSYQYLKRLVRAEKDAD